MNWQPLAVGTVLALATGLPLAWKWQLGMRKCAVALLVLGGVIAIPLGLLVDQSSALLLHRAVAPHARSRCRLGPLEVLPRSGSHAALAR